MVGTVSLDCCESLVSLEVVPLVDLSTFIPVLLRRSSLKNGILTL